MKAPAPETLESAEAARAPAVRKLAEGRDWAITEQICRAGPQDRPFEERHDRVALSVVLAGTFGYRTDTGRALLYPGAVLLGNAGRCFECGHEHGRGDRCVAFHLAPALFEEIARAATGSSRFRFRVPMLPALRAMAPPTAGMEALAAGAARGSPEEIVIGIAEAIVAAAAGSASRAGGASAGDERRVARALRLLDEHAGDSPGLDRLAAECAMSKFHFLRVFRRTTGVTPWQYVLALRMRRAATRLRTSKVPVSTIAFEAGFGDLSTFNHRFRAAFGTTPSRYRRLA